VYIIYTSTWYYLEEEMIVRNPKKRVNIMLDESQRVFLRRVSKERGISASEFIRGLIEERKKREQEIRLEKAAVTLAEEYLQN
jgi:bifunctional DNA-binding transcriptional regulator/antitoxin component of YhaV-PrlF toxin-antitoxin module